MRHPNPFSVAVISLAILGLVLAPAAQGQAQGPWTVAMRAMQNPLPVGQCTAIEVVVRDANGATPLRPDGRQLDWQDFELSFTSAAPDAFAWSNERHRFLCAKAPTAAVAIVVAHYPGSHLLSNEILPGVNVSQQVEVYLQGVPAPAVATAAPTPPPTPAPGHPYAPSSAAGPGSSQAPTTQVVPGQPYQPPGYQPQPTPPAQSGASAAGYPQPGAPADPNAAQAYGPSSGYQPQTTVPAAPQYGASPAPTQAAGPTTPQNGAAPAPQTQVDNKPVKGLGGLFQKIGAHAKKTVGEVTSQTAENLASGANQIVDVTAQTGSGLVSGATAQASSAARSTVSGVGKSILPSKGQSDNLAAALTYGEAVFRNKLFSGSSEVLEPAGRDLVDRLAAEFKTRPGRFQIQVHVDPIENALQLSEQRAAVLKSALIQRGVEKSKVESLGYGASMLKPEIPPDGGKVSSERVVITQIKTQ
jgi:outer membrane protein OmpA-like peptidoglycan-associated protein